MLFVILNFEVLHGQTRCAAVRCRMEARFDFGHVAETIFTTESRERSDTWRLGVAFDSLRLL